MTTQKLDWKTTFTQVYQRMAFHYGQTFLRTVSEDQQGQLANYWQRHLHTERIRAEEMLAAIDQIIVSQRFRTFPPNPAEFVGFVHKMRAKTLYQIPEPEEAFHQACGLEKPIHPLSRYVRSKMGSWFIRTQSDRNMRSRFFQLYEEAAEALSRGTLSLPTETEKATPRQEEKAMPGAEVASRLDRLINSPEP